MINRTLNSDIQPLLFPIISETESLIEKAIKKETGIAGKSQITAMPDLGFANNSTRMNGGFFTGMHIQWECSIPFVPVDATVNSCGVCIFYLNKDFSEEDFFLRIQNAKAKFESTEYNWNFQNGNHFIILGKSEEGKLVIVMHASADEYKYSKKNYALYPYQSVWYYKDIKTIFSSYNTRYLRYLSGQTAERFISIALNLENINHQRFIDVADLLFGNDIINEVVYVPHYGMPDNSSIAIGCSWKKDYSVLLTRSGMPLYITIPNSNSSDLWLNPHGLGSFSPNVTSISFDNSKLNINGLPINSNEDVKNIKDKNIRGLNYSNEEYQKFINRILIKSNSLIKTSITPLISLSANGITYYNKKGESL